MKRVEHGGGVLNACHRSRSVSGERVQHRDLHSLAERGTTVGEPGRVGLPGPAWHQVEQPCSGSALTVPVRSTIPLCNGCSVTSTSTRSRTARPQSRPARPRGRLHRPRPRTCPDCEMGVRGLCIRELFAPSAAPRAGHAVPGDCTHERLMEPEVGTTCSPSSPHTSPPATAYRSTTNTHRVCVLRSLRVTADDQQHQSPQREHLLALRYSYSVCLGQHQKRTDCTQATILVTDVENLMSTTTSASRSPGDARACSTAAKPFTVILDPDVQRKAPRQQ